MEVVESTVDVIEDVLAILATATALATLWFFVFWTWFDFWRRRPTLAYGALALLLGSGIGACIAFRSSLFETRVELPTWTQAIGWAVIAVVVVFGTIADAQIGIRVRSFMPFFDRSGRIDLVTNGTYGVVRHPIYAAGMWFQVGVFLVTGYIAVLAAFAIFAVGALWFTRREEERLMELLDDPDEYVRYRSRVPGLVPRFARRQRSARL